MCWGHHTLALAKSRPTVTGGGTPDQWPGSSDIPGQAVDGRGVTSCTCGWPLGAASQPLHSQTIRCRRTHRSMQIEGGNEQTKQHIPGLWGDFWLNLEVGKSTIIPQTCLLPPI
jgi:hypothetical protein